MLRTPWPTSEVGYGGRGSQKGLGEGAATLAPRHLHPEHASQTAGYKHRIKRVYALLSNPRKKKTCTSKQTNRAKLISGEDYATKARRDVA